MIANLVLAFSLDEAKGTIGKGRVPASVGTPDVLAWHRRAPSEHMLVVVNFAEESRSVTLPSEGSERFSPVGGSHPDPRGPDDRNALTMRPLEAVILRVD